MPIGKRGRVGLFNLGNSCYMSSSLQCLSHVYPLTTYFLSGRYVGDINEVSKDSTGGRLVSAIRILYFTLLYSILSANFISAISIYFAHIPSHSTPLSLPLSLPSSHFSHLSCLFSAPSLFRQGSTRH